jgi:molecular chaperone GrpE (heat shock protein)
MTPFQEELFRLIQDCKQESNAFTSSQEDAGNEITRLSKFSEEWDFKSKFENVQKINEQLNNKLAQEKIEAETRAIRTITKELIPIVDDLFLLLKVSAEDAAINKTVKLLLVNFESYLRRHDGAFIRPKIGEALNPIKHRAVAVVEAPLAVTSTIEEVYRIGYIIKNQVLREAEVKVRCAVKST